MKNSVNHNALAMTVVVIVIVIALIVPRTVVQVAVLKCVPLNYITKLLCLLLIALNNIIELEQFPRTSFFQDSNNSSDENDMDDDKANIRLHVVPKDENNANAKNSNIHKADRNERKKCRVCDGIERCNPQSKPEIFVECSKCRRTGMCIICYDLNHHFENENSFNNLSCESPRFCSSSNVSQDVNANGATSKRICMAM